MAAVDQFYGDDGMDPLTGKPRVATDPLAPLDPRKDTTTSNTGTQGAAGTAPVTTAAPPTLAKQWSDYGMTASTQGDTGSVPVDRTTTDPPLPGITPAPTSSADKAAAFGQQSATGHDGTAANGMTREQYRDAWMSSGVHDLAGLKAWTAANGGNVVSDNGTVTTPFGETLDMLIGAKTGNGQPGWTGTGGGAGGASASGVGSTTSGGAYYDALVAQLQARAGQTLNVGRFDPTVRAQADANAANEERSRREYLAAAAEHGSPYGVGAQRGQERMTAESVGQRTGAFEAQLVQQEINARRTEIQNALAQEGQMYSDQQKLALQKELGLLDAQLKREQMSQSGSQFDQTLNFNSQDRQAYWNALNSGLITG